MDGCVFNDTDRNLHSLPLFLNPEPQFQLLRKDRALRQGKVLRKICDSVDCGAD